MKSKVESFDDIVFENRNKDYGAFELRKKYSKRGAIALSVSIFLLFSAVGVPLIASIMNKVDYSKYVSVEGPNVLSPVDVEKVVVPPPPPPPPASVKEIKFFAPAIVDTLSNEEIEFATADDFSGLANIGKVDTTSQQYEVKVDVNKDELDDTPIEIINVKEKPSFPGGEAALLKYIAEHTNYPASALEKDIEGKVYIRFVVTKTGNIGETKVLRSADPLLEEEALKVVKSMPKWTPGKNNGNPVNVWFIIPVKFVLQK